MKYLIIIAALVLPTFAMADDVDDLSQILRQTECTPVRDQSGSISKYHCEGPGSESLNTSAPQRFKDMELTSELENSDPKLAE